MRKLTILESGLIALLAISAGCTRQVSFKNDVFPIFQERCMTCHAPGSPGCVVSGFSVATYESLMKGTKYGAMIVPGSSLDSNLLRLVKHEADPSIAMPRSLVPGKPSEWLKPEQINLIETWINQGAKNN
ncbi:MAG: c-type cytochrome domain-containing protein [Steroidobacteraceae bacterium]|jgi:cytochrome c